MKPKQQRQKIEKDPCIREKDSREIHNVTYLDPKDLIFRKTAGGFLALAVTSDKNNEEKQYDRVHLYCSFPFSLEEEFISVRDSEDKEIGIIRSLDRFDRDTRELLRDELSSRYFIPMVTKVFSAKEEFGYSYWDCETTAGRCRFTVQSSGTNSVVLGDHHIILIDVDGNRFEIEDYRQLSSPAIRIMETLI